MPYCVHASGYGTGHFRDYLQRGTCGIVPVDVARIGGVTPWLKVVPLAEALTPRVAHEDRLMTAEAPPRARNGGLLRLHADDNIAVATRDLAAGEVVVLDDTEIRLAETVPTGHKVAIRSVRPGEKIVKYRIPIGSATRPIRPGDYVHTHNLTSDYIPTYTLEEGRRFEEGRA